MGPRRTNDDLKVFIVTRDTQCGDCGEELMRSSWITLRDDNAFCLPCADLDHLVFLPSGDAALTRRSRKHSTLCAVVLKFSRARKRYERQGLLVQEAALEQAEEECLADEDARSRKRERAAERRAELDQEYVEQFADRVRELYPACPPGRERIIAEHACLKYSGRVGRSAEAKQFDENAIELAVAAHLRHTETDYDSLLAQGLDRHEARREIRTAVDVLVDSWRFSDTSS